MIPLVSFILAIISFFNDGGNTGPYLMICALSCVTKPDYD